MSNNGIPIQPTKDRTYNNPTTMNKKHLKKICQTQHTLKKTAEELGTNWGNSLWARGGQALQQNPSGPQGQGGSSGHRRERKLREWVAKTFQR